LTLLLGCIAMRGFAVPGPAALKSAQQYSESAGGQAMAVIYDRRSAPGKRGTVLAEFLSLVRGGPSAGQR
jgi:hypothetical protein